MLENILTPAIPLVLLVLVGFTLLRSTMRIVPQQTSWIVERLGRYSRTLEPGLNILMPFVDRVAYRFDLREVPLEVPPQVCI